MKPALRKRFVWAFMVFLALAALASLAGVLSLVLERRGMIVLRRVPSPVLRTWKDERGVAVAVINTDTTPGSFLLGFGDSHGGGSTLDTRFGYRERRGKPLRGGEERVWVPGRSIVLRSHPRLLQPDFIIWLYDAQGSIGLYEDSTVWRAVPRGTCATLGWDPTEWNPRAPPDGFLIQCIASCSPYPQEALRVVQRPGVAFRANKGGPRDDPWFDWDGKTTISFEFDTTTPPDILEMSAIVTEHALHGAARHAPDGASV